MGGRGQDPVDVGATKEALQEREARLRSILETAPDAIIVIDERGIMESYSQAAERLFGYRADEALGQNVKILMPPPYRERHDSYIDHYLKTGERRIIGIGRVVVGQRRDGSTFPMELSVGEVKLACEAIATQGVRYRFAGEDEDGLHLRPAHLQTMVWLASSRDAGDLQILYLERWQSAMLRPEFRLRQKIGK